MRLWATGRWRRVGLLRRPAPVGRRPRDHGAAGRCCPLALGCWLGTGRRSLLVVAADGAGRRRWGATFRRQRGVYHHLHAGALDPAVVQGGGHLGIRAVLTAPEDLTARHLAVLDTITGSPNLVVLLKGRRRGWAPRCNNRRPPVGQQCPSARPRAGRRGAGGGGGRFLLRGGRMRTLWSAASQGGSGNAPGVALQWCLPRPCSSAR